MTSPDAKEDHYCHARMISHLHLWTHPGLLSVYISHQSLSLWMMKAASLLGHLRATGTLLNPADFLVPIQRTAGISLSDGLLIC